MATNNVSTIVELNVGGVFYSTSVATLTSEPGSKLALMFDLSELQNNEESTLLKDSKVCHNHQRRKYGRCSPNSLRPISYFGSIWELYVLDLKSKVFCRKENQLHFPMDKELTVPK